MPAPGGSASPLYVRSGIGPTGWTRMTSPPYMSGAGAINGWYQAKRIFRAVSTSINPATLLPETVWQELVDYRSPAGLSVPGVGISKSHAAPTYSANATWTAITDPNDIRYQCFISYIFWNLTQATSDSGSIDQSWGLVRSSIGWDLGEEVYATLTYVNGNGSGVPTDTPHIFLGP